MGRKTHPELSDDHAFSLMNAIAYSMHKEMRLTYLVTIHLEKAEVKEEDAQAFVGGFFKELGELLRSWSGGPPTYVWILENPGIRGLHLHALVHVPALKKGAVRLRRRFRALAASDWLEKFDAVPGDAVVRIDRVKGTGRGDPVSKYIDRGLKYGAGYLFKGWPKHERYGIEVSEWNKGPQGVVVGKRSGASENLGPTRRKNDWSWTSNARLKVFTSLGWDAPPPGQL
jgi:hypothetical protein